MIIPTDKISKEQLNHLLKESSTDELNYLLNLYYGPSKLILREKVFGYELAQKVQRLISDELAYRSIDNILLEK